MTRLHGCAVGLVLSFGAACGSAPVVPGVMPSRESGQSALMGETFAGANKCSPENHERPFVIEWDATDMSSFEARTATDVVVVKYEGCNMRVLDGCSNDSIRGANGAYKVPEWTGGSLEKIDIASEGELYAKLPLGAAELGGRVKGGEKFHMEYYVSGTRTATRAAVYEKELANNPACRGATHFVYAYNLGAFALGSVKSLEGSVDASLWGFGAGGKHGKKNDAEKHGGDLAKCTGDSAREVSSCKMPIRLTLRPIDKGDNPDVQAAKAPETDASLNLAGKLASQGEQATKANEHRQAAMQKQQARDGKGCLAELDAADKLENNVTLHSTQGALLGFRAFCLMLSGQCDTGKRLARIAEQARSRDALPATIDETVERQAGQFCQGDKRSPRDTALGAANDLRRATYQAVPLATCKTAYDTLKKLLPTLKSEGEDDFNYKTITSTPGMAAQCFAKAGDCKTAWQVYQAEHPKALRASFDGWLASCKDR
ncbi:MAG: hypothetical protein WKG00_04325 [Polyangiaceae bacterium]